MIQCKRYPHVQDLIEHYAQSTNNTTILSLLNQGVKNEQEATLFAQFIW